MIINDTAECSHNFFIPVKHFIVTLKSSPYCTLQKLDDENYEQMLSGPYSKEILSGTSKIWGGSQKGEDLIIF